MKSENQTTLSSSQEDYLEAIAELIVTHGHAHTKEIAERLNVKMPSVTSALKTLAEMGLVEYQPNRPVTLTFEGSFHAQKVIRKHQAFKRFFQNILGLPEEKADQIACRMEHLIDPETELRFLAFVDVMETCGEARTRIAELTAALERIQGKKSVDSLINFKKIQ